jgi:cation-transporting ATPase E
MFLFITLARRVAVTSLTTSASIRGLTGKEVKERLAHGQSNAVRVDTSRAYRQIVRENLLTFVNIVLFGLGAALVVIGRPIDALVSVGVLFFNSIVAIAQEIRAKRILDRIRLLYQPMATVIRDGQELSIAPQEIVLDDILKVGPGDQILVDGSVVGDGRMNLDESQLTGESDLQTKEAGDPVYSGSYCVSGSAYIRAEKVGADSFANQLAAEARASRRILTPLQKQINLTIRIILLMVVYLELLIIANDAIRAAPLPEEIEHATVIASIIPTTLLLTIAVAYAVGAVRVVRFGALAQQANAMDTLSNVDLLCLDKTGTLTTNQFKVAELRSVETGEGELAEVLSIITTGQSAPNKTTKAIALAYPAEPREIVTEVPFSSARKWSAVAVDAPDRRGIFVLGALEMLRPYLDSANAESESFDKWQLISQQAGQWEALGLRVLLVAYHPDPQLLEENGEDSILPQGMVPLGLVSLRDELRGDAREVLSLFAQTGVELKIISGDNPGTVAALAVQVGFDRDVELRAAEKATIFGRISPHQKEQLVDELQRQGRFVAMVGDGVNDVLSLKKADLGIAMQSGAQATRGVADIILIHDSFDSLGPAVAEGQRIVNGMQDVLKLYLSRITTSMLLILSAVIVGGVFPITLRQRPLFTTLTVSLPALLLALWARPGRPLKNSSLAAELMHFALPPTITSTLFGLVVFYGLLSIRLLQGAEPISLEAELLLASSSIVDLSQTALVAFLTIVGLLLVIFVEPPTEWWTGADELSGDWRPTLLTIGLFLAFAAILVIPSLQSFFDIAPLQWLDIIMVVFASVAWLFATRYAWRRRLIQRYLGIGPG